MPPDINASRDNFTVDGEGIRFGLAAVKNVGESALKMIVQIREKDGVFKSLEDFCSRVSSKYANRRALENLIKCGAFDSLGYNRAQNMEVLDQAMEMGARKLKDAASGQMDLFGEFTEEPVESIIMPKVNEFTKMEMLSMEKDITGFYITGHPLEEFNDKICNLATIEEISKMADNKFVSFAGIIRKAKRITTKKGDMMCFLEVEDFIGSMEVVVFPRAFYDNINNLVADTPVVVRGRINHMDEETKIIADKVIGLDEYVPEFCIMLKPEQESQEFFSKVTDILHEHSGNCPVFMYFLSTKKMVKGNKEFWIDGSPEVFAELQNLLGKRAVKQR